MSAYAMAIYAEMGSFVIIATIHRKADNIANRNIVYLLGPRITTDGSGGSGSFSFTSTHSHFFSKE